jgi:hypothetical protein
LNHQHWADENPAPYEAEMHRVLDGYGTLSSVDEIPSQWVYSKKEVSRLLIKEDNCEVETGDHPLTTACVISSVFSAFRSMYL